MFYLNRLCPQFGEFQHQTSTCTSMYKREFFTILNYIVHDAEIWHGSEGMYTVGARVVHVRRHRWEMYKRSGLCVQNDESLRLQTSRKFLCYSFLGKSSRSTCLSLWKCVCVCVCAWCDNHYNYLQIGTAICSFSWHISIWPRPFLKVEVEVMHISTTNMS